jgi:hypothetical protein
MWTEVSSSVPHFLHMGSLHSPMICKCFLKVLCPVSRPITILVCVLLKDSSRAPIARSEPEINSRACLCVLQGPRHNASCSFSIQRFRRKHTTYRLWQKFEIKNFYKGFLWSNKASHWLIHVTMDYNLVFQSPSCISMTSPTPQWWKQTHHCTHLLQKLKTVYDPYKLLFLSQNLFLQITLFTYNYTVNHCVNVSSRWNGLLKQNNALQSQIVKTVRHLLSYSRQVMVFCNGYHSELRQQTGISYSYESSNSVKPPISTTVIIIM